MTFVRRLEHFYVRSVAKVGVRVDLVGIAVDKNHVAHRFTRARPHSHECFLFVLSDSGRADNGNGNGRVRKNSTETWSSGAANDNRSHAGSHQPACRSKCRKRHDKFLGIGRKSNCPAPQRYNRTDTRREFHVFRSKNLRTAGRHRGKKRHRRKETVEIRSSHRKRTQAQHVVENRIERANQHRGGSHAQHAHG